MGKIISVDTWVREALDRIEAFCGDRPVDYFCEMAEEEIRNWTDENGWTDWNAVEDEIDSHADIYMEFIRDCYPECVREGV